VVGGGADVVVGAVDVDDVDADDDFGF